VVSDAEADIRHGSKIGRFVVVGELGRGGMGLVYRAHDPELDRPVALKVLRSAAATEEERMRMLREGQAMARVTHPNVITVYEVGVAGSVVFLAQELMDGGTLGGWLDKRHPREAILEKFVAAGRGLAAAHAAGLVHRDFKPENVLLGTDGRVRVADFGLARALGTDDSLAAETRANIARAQRELSSSPMSPLTRTGAVMGTPMFMAPEQHLGERADERSDQFAFCVALYHALYGEWPYPGQTTEAVANAVIKGRLQAEPRGTDVPAKLRQILVRGLATAPANRFPSMDALLAELTRPPSRAGRRIAIGVGALLLVGGAVVGGYALRTSDPPPKQKPIAAFDAKSLTNERGTAWLLTTIERGQLDDAAEKYEMASALAQEQPAQAAIASSCGALVLALRGHLAEARTKLEKAVPGADPVAKAYVDLATAAISLGAGKLDAAIEKGAACATSFAGSVPALAALCAELRGDATAAKGDTAKARAIYSAALAKAKQGGDRTLGLELGLVALDLDDVKPEAAAATAATLQTTANELGASGPEARAWILLARAHLAEAASQQALDDLGHIRPATIEPFRIRIEHAIANGQSIALLGDPDEGFGKIDAAANEAEAQGFPGLALAARLARMEVMVTLGQPDAAAQRAALIKDARAQGYLRIVKLAMTIEQR